MRLDCILLRTILSVYRGEHFLRFSHDFPRISDFIPLRNLRYFPIMLSFLSNVRNIPVQMLTEILNNSNLSFSQWEVKRVP